MEFLNSGRVLPATLPFSEAVRHGDTLYLSGQVGIAPGTMALVSGGIREETRQTMENIKASLEAHGCSLANVVVAAAVTVPLSAKVSFDVSMDVAIRSVPARSTRVSCGTVLEVVLVPPPPPPPPPEQE